MHTLRRYRHQLTYDALGSITAFSTTTAATSTYSYAETGFANPHAVTSIGGTTYTYDNNGNVTAIGSLDYTWDWRNRLSSAERSGGGITAYGYDHTVQRVLQATGNATTSYPNRYYNVASSSLTATTTKHIFSPDGTLLATVVGSGAANASTTYLHPDHLGGTNVATDENGEVVQTLDYYPFGSQRIATGSFDEQRKFTGHEYDTESDLTYAGARYYNQDIGRFLSQDPDAGEMIDPQSLNKYSYVLNNPLKFLDPTGKFTVLFTGAGNSRVDMEAIRQQALGRAADLGLPPPTINIYRHQDKDQAYIDAVVSQVMAHHNNTVDPIVIAGHSRGGKSAIDLARRLGAHGFDVQSLVQIESVGIGDDRLPDNVGQGYNFSVFGWNFLGGESYVQGSLNYSLTSISGFSHTNIDNPVASPLPGKVIAREVAQAAAKSFGIGNSLGNFAGTYNFGPGIGTFDFGAGAWTSQTTN